MGYIPKRTINKLASFKHGQYSMPNEDAILTSPNSGQGMVCKCDPELW